jgi:plastocyanin
MHNSTRFLFLGATLALIVFVGQACAPGRSETNTNTTPPPVTGGASGTLPADAVEDVISYDGNTFSPSTITVQVGETVQWLNVSQGSMQVASDPHPTHQNLPELGSGAVVPVGEIFSFTFTETGRWDYHDHLNTAARGVVIVE